MTTFALVHGAWHGGWCWNRVAPLLRAAGHTAIAMDLPTEDASAGTAEYSRVVLDALEGHTDGGPVVLVGHSAAGLTLPLVAAARPVERMVFVSALLPVPGEPFTVQNEREHVLLDDYQAGVERTPAGLRRWFDPDLAARFMYSNCSAADAAWAYERLRPQASTMYTERSPLDAWPDVPVIDVRSDRDLLVSPQWAAAALCPPTRRRRRGRRSRSRRPLRWLWQANPFGSPTRWRSTGDGTTIQGADRPVSAAQRPRIEADETQPEVEPPRARRGRRPRDGPPRLRDHGSALEPRPTGRSPPRRPPRPQANQARRVTAQIAPPDRDRVRP